MNAMVRLVGGAGPCGGPLMPSIGQLMRRMPELRLIEPRLADPMWHPTEQEIADALAVVSGPRKARQTVLPLDSTGPTQ